MTLYKSDKELEVKNPCGECKLSIKWDDCPKSTICHYYIRYLAQLELLSQLKEVDIEWKDKPDSEDWWWFRYGDSLEYLAISKLTYIVVHDAKILIDEEYNYVDKLRKGKWCKAIVPEIEEQK